MNEHPLVSVIVSCYNHATYIEECLLSILNQSYPKMELLVVDDGSTDESAKRIQKLKEQYDFDFRTQPNKGLSSTLNDCVKRSNGSLIAPFDSDDIMMPDKIRTQVDYMQDKPEVGICGGNIQNINDQGEPLPKKDRIRSLRRLNFDNIFSDNMRGAPGNTMLIRREAFEKVGGYNPEIKIQDLYIMLKIAYAGYYVDVLEEVLAKYRDHEDNIHKNMDHTVNGVLRIYADYKDHPDYLKTYAHFINSMFLKTAKKDKRLARELFGKLPIKYWDMKTIRAIGRYLL
jgi:alpha-1,3-rhamnosyltransferase